MTISLRPERVLWDLDRFGLSPRKLLARARAGTEPKILCVALPKAGTHLVERALCLHPRLYRPLVPTIHPRNLYKSGGLTPLLRRLRPGEIIISHLYFHDDYVAALSECGVKTILVIRDPRDMVVSEAHYIAKTKSHYMHDIYRGLSERERLRLSILGYRWREHVSITARLRGFAGWLDSGALVVRFEDLRSDRVHTALSSLYRHIGVEVDEAFLAYLEASLVSRASPTFRSGAIEQWREEFDEEIQTLFDEEVGDLCAEYGYPADE